MTHVALKTMDGKDRRLSEASLNELQAGIRGRVCRPGDPGYDEARTIWNAMIDRRPAVAVRAAEAGDVVRSVTFARDHQLLLAVRGGGHNIAGNAVAEGGLLIDLSLMNAVDVDVASRTARVGPGATIADVDRATQAAGLATPLGINSTTGIAGLTLGGGFGWLSRQYGLTVDNLLSVEIVTADGTLRRASAKENPDLFWAVRGGGGNFGIVTSFQFGLHPIGNEVLSGLIVHRLDDAKSLLAGFRRFTLEAPDEVTAWAVLRKAPPLPFLPEEVHGKEILVFAVCVTGDLKQAEHAIAPLRQLGRPVADVIGPTPYAGWQQALDPLLTPGARNYWKSHDFQKLDDGLLDVLVDSARRLPGPECEILLVRLGGAINRVAPTDTAYPHRDVEFLMNLHGRWREPEQDRECIGWARATFEAAAPFASGAVYVNFMPADESERVQRGAYGANFDRLAKLKAKYDPANLFRMNQNIAPAG